MNIPPAGYEREWNITGVGLSLDFPKQTCLKQFRVINMTNHSPLFSRLQECADTCWSGELQRRRPGTVKEKRRGKTGQDCRSGELLGVQDREPGSSLVPQTTPIRPLASDSASLTTNVLMWIQAVNKYETETTNVGAEAAGCPLIVIFLFSLAITMLIWWGSTTSVL